jgi:hypothetical protein
MSQYKNHLLFFSILSVVCFNQPTQAYAWFFGLDWGGHHDSQGGYTEVAVGGDRYFYNEGVFYTGAPGNYVVVQAPVGAIVYTAPADFEQVNVDGVVYYRSHNIYYRPEGRGYRVVERPHEHHPMGDGQERHGP